jgi:hypothetical protein
VGWDDHGLFGRDAEEAKREAASRRRYRAISGRHELYVVEQGRIHFERRNTRATYGDVSVTRA